MAKRKTVVNDIIYELDPDDIEISSEEECKGNHPISSTKALHNNGNSDEIVNLECSDDGVLTPQSNKTKPNDLVLIDDSPIRTKKFKHNSECDSLEEVVIHEEKKPSSDQDIPVGSPSSNTDLGVVGCENRSSLVSVHFRDRGLARKFKSKLKSFLLRLIKQHGNDSAESDADSDVDLDIWPEDLEEEDIKEPKKTNDTLFFVDTAPIANEPIEIPNYSQHSKIISNTPQKAPSPTLQRKGPLCFNCDGPHSLKDCRFPRNHSRIAEKRKNISQKKTGRYHVEDEQKYGHLKPGRISGALRHALGLNRHQLPLYIYRMRLLGYPPAWLEEAKISHSGISMFDSTGNAILDPEEEEGEISQPGSKDKFDIKKIIDYPGFNVAASSKYKEEAHIYGLPPMSEDDSKLTMLQMLAPNAVKAYKRKRLSLFPSAEVGNTSKEGLMEMDIDSGDEATEFPTAPPLPDEAPPPPPPPPPSSPPPDTCDDDDTNADKSKHDVIGVELIDDNDLSGTEWIILDEDIQSSQVSRECVSPTLDDLEEKKLTLMKELQNDSTCSENVSQTTENEGEEIDNTEVKDQSQKMQDSSSLEVDSSKDEISNETFENRDDSIAKNSDDSKEIKTPESSKGRVKATTFGTPVINSVSEYTKLPSDDKFSKDICDVINFENLPNSTGKYKELSSLLKKVKVEVDRIQES